MYLPPMSINPRVGHILDQYMALTLEVQARLRSHRDDLIAEGWHPAEAWALCQRAEERILGPAMDRTREAVRQIEDVEATVRKVLEDLTG